MVQAYVFINIQAGKARDVVGKLRRKKFIKKVHLVTGLHDAIAFIEGKNIKALANNITEGIHKVTGITKTVTCIIVNGK